MPAAHSPVQALAFTTATAVSAHRAVAVTGGYAVAAGRLFGLAEYDVAAGDTGSATTLGTGIATAGEPILLGDELEVGANGKLVVATAGIVVARAMQAATGDGSLFEAQLL